MTSPAGRCSATALLLATVLPALASLTIRDWRVGAGAVVVDLVLVLPLVAPRPRTLLPRTLLRLLPGLVAAASITWSTWLFGTGSGWSVPAASGLRVLALVIPGALLLTSLDPARLGDELGQWFGAPGRPVLAAVAALEQVEFLAGDWRTITAARRSRGVGPGRSPLARARAGAGITVALLAGALHRAGAMSDAMTVRGLGAVQRRTWATPARWTRVDSLCAVVAVALTATPLIGRFG